ncbi:MAG TPA: hypothetical protein DCE41_19170, partial [Cytophagales bacterium]|nr:hypothetical protein [Cytophagales bacterium]
MQAILENFPLFEPNQVLSSRHLNDLRDYLDRQNALTRSKLLGTGIFSGLEVTLEADKLHISAGAGATSEGMLLNYLGGTYTHFTRYDGLGRYTSITETLAAQYAEDGEDTRVPVIFELFTEDDPQLPVDAETLNENHGGLFDQGVVMLYVEEVSTELKSCFANTCDEHGKEVKFYIRPLIIPRHDAEILYIQTEPTTFQYHARAPKLELRPLPTVHIPPTTAGDNHLHVFEAFRDVLESYLPKLKEDLNQTWLSINPLFTFNRNSQNNIDYVWDQKDWYADGFDHDITTTHHVYDLVRTITIAHQEFRNLLLDLIPDNLFEWHRSFPDFLFLGSLSLTEGSGLAYEVNSLNIRHHHIKALRNEAGTIHYRKAIEAWYRLNVLISSTSLPGASEVTLLTPSPGHSAPLGTWAMPIYVLPESIEVVWSTELSGEHRTAESLSYHKTAAEPDKSKHPIAYAHDSKDFYRVEGYKNRPLSEVMDELLEARRMYHLDFEVLPLKVGGREVTNTDRREWYCQPTYLRYQEQYTEARQRALQSLSNLRQYFSFDGYNPAHADAIARYKEAIDRRVGLEELTSEQGLQIVDLLKEIKLLMEVLNQEALSRFDFNRFHETYRNMHTRLTTYLMVTNGVMIDLVISFMKAESGRNFNFGANAFNQLIRAFQNLVLDPTWYHKLQALYIQLRQFQAVWGAHRLDDFGAFLEQNPSLTHLGGVHRGGLLVLLYGDHNGQSDVVLADFQSRACCFSTPEPPCPDSDAWTTALKATKALPPYAHPEFGYTYPGAPIVLHLLTNDALYPVGT